MFLFRSSGLPLSGAWWLTTWSVPMDSRKSQTLMSSPAKQGGLPLKLDYLNGRVITARAHNPGFSINWMQKIIRSKPTAFVWDYSICPAPIPPHDSTTPAKSPTNKACSDLNKLSPSSSPIAISFPNNLSYKPPSFHKTTKTFVALSTSTKRNL